jgi:hypothetical protein
MKTDHLIAALVTDQAQRAGPVGPALGLAAGVGFALAGILFMLALGPRDDIAAAATTMRFLFKPALMLALAVAAGMLALRLVRPGTAARPAALGAVAGVLIIAVAAELLVVPRDAWAARLIGTNAQICLTSIPLLAIAPLAAALYALRRGAPTRPALAGAAAGLLAGGIGAALYATHCTDDSPLFVATWYSLAIALVAIAGALLGTRLLRW